jgi:hypothetical protein
MSLFSTPNGKSPCHNLLVSPESYSKTPDILWEYVLVSLSVLLKVTPLLFCKDFAVILILSVFSDATKMRTSIKKHSN